MKYQTVQGHVWFNQFLGFLNEIKILKSLLGSLSINFDSFFFWLWLKPTACNFVFQFDLEIIFSSIDLVILSEKFGEKLFQ